LQAAIKHAVGGFHQTPGIATLVTETELVEDLIFAAVRVQSENRAKSCGTACGG
jgi:hypothetical protein